GFVTMAGARATKEAPEVGVGMFGYAFMGKAHTNAYKKLPYMVYPPPAVPRLVAVAGRNEEGVREAAKRYGYEKYYTDWRQLIEEGALGEIYHFRAIYLQEWIMDPNFERVWRLDKKLAGSGALGDLGAHVIDLGRFLVGEPKSVMALTKTFITERPLPGGGRG